MPSIFHDRFACLIFENLFKGSESAEVEVEDQWFDTVNKPPVFGGTTMRCDEVFGASAYAETRAAETGTRGRAVPIRLAPRPAIFVRP